MTQTTGADANWIKVALEEKSKQSTGTTMMQQVHNQYQAKVAKKKGKTAVTK
jgi:predicted DNA-binding protein (MmcQ/YjbR family)